MTFYFLRDGSLNDLSKSGAGDRHPRTAVAFNNDYVFFVVVDGRDLGVSEGMNMTELGNFCKDYLGATDGMNMDGGGSSTIWVNGEVKNNPSDYTGERSVANGLMMINLLPKAQSSAFSLGAEVRTKSLAYLRLGPGSNYGSMATLSAGDEGTVVEHALNGIYAKGQYWWKCSFNPEGWVAEDDLELVPGPTPPPTEATANWHLYE
jgi:hypothetical protein